jgi:hypothetical protein
VTGLILVAGAIFFSIFASGTVQPWAEQRDGIEERSKKRLEKNLPENLSKPLIKPLLSEEKN